MLVFFKQKLAFLSVPKTGSTAYELTLRKRADVIFTKGVKHMTASKFQTQIAPLLAESYRIRPEIMAVMRDPVDQIRSWYKFRSPERMGAHIRSTAGKSFDEYVLDVISDSPPPAAKIGSQYRFLTLEDGSLGVHRLFQYENQPRIHGFLEDRFQDTIQLKAQNVSPDVPAEISPDVEAKLRAAKPDDFALYDRLLDAGGMLQTAF